MQEFRFIATIYTFYQDLRLTKHFQKFIERLGF